MGHLPYRNWCPICVKAQGKDRDHVKDDGKERGLPEYNWDYCFPGDQTRSGLSRPPKPLEQRKTKIEINAKAPYLYHNLLCLYG